MRLDELTLDAWENATPAARAAWMQDAAARVAGTCNEGAITVRGVRLALVPGGSVALGWDGTSIWLEPERRAEWQANTDFDGTFEALLRYYFGPARTVSIAPFLIETVATSISDLGVDPYGDDPEISLRQVIERAGFRLPSNDEWEVAMRAGRSTMFAWGDAWPDGAGPASADPYRGSRTFTAHTTPNALGVEPRTNSYETEVVAERNWLRGGDGGTAVCGGRPAPEAWYSFALAFQLPRGLWGDVVCETFEQAFVRRALSLF